MPLLSTALLIAHATSQNLPTSLEQVDAYIQSQMQAQHIPGLVIRIVKDGQVIKNQAYGLASIEKKTPTTVDHIFDMGSIGKTFTAVLAMQLVERGQLKLSDPVNKHFVGWPEAWKSVTIRHLLSHQSGLPEYALVPGVGLADSFTEDVWINAMLKLPLDFEPGLQFQYSNTNFVVMGMILERKTGKSYEQLLDERIFGPAGMKNTTFRHLRSSLPKGAAEGYFWQDEFINGGVGGLHHVNSDGGGFTSVEDLNKFNSALKSGKLLGRSSVNQMQSFSRTSSGRRTTYGLGWFVNKVEGHPQITHGGNSVGFSGTLSTFPSKGLEIYMLCNLYPIGGDAFALSIARILHPDLRVQPQASGTEPNPTRQEKLKAGLAALANNAVMGPLFHADMINRIATGRGQMSAAAFANMKEISEFNYIKEWSDSPDTVVRYRVKAGANSYLVDFTIDTNGLIYSIGRLPDPGEPPR